MISAMKDFYKSAVLPRLKYAALASLSIPLANTAFNAISNAGFFDGGYLPAMVVGGTLTALSAVPAVSGVAGMIFGDPKPPTP